MFFSILVFTDDALCRHLFAFVTGMHGNVFGNLRQQQRTMSYISVRRQFITHLHQMNLFSFHAQMDGTFASGQSASEYHYLIRHFVFLQIIVVDDNHVISVQTRNRRNQRTGTYRDDESVRLLILHVFSGHFRVQADLHACPLCQQRIGLTQIVHFFLERNGLLAFEDTAQRIALFTEDHLMASSGRRIGRIETARSAACHQHFLFHRSRLDFHTFHFPSDQRIYRTSSGGCGRSFRHTGKAAQTVNDLIVLVSHHLARQKRICQQRSRHIHHICLAAGDDLFHLLGTVQSAERGHRNLHVFFNLRRQIYVAAVFLKHRRMGIAESSLVRTRRHMKQVDVRLDLLRDTASFFQIITLLKKLGAA